MSSFGIRVYYKILGGHVHCRVFTNGKNGDLVFDVNEWPLICSTLFGSSYVDLREEDDDGERVEG